MSPQLIADVTLSSAAEGGKKIDAQPGWGAHAVARSPRLLLGRLAAALYICGRAALSAKRSLSPSHKE